VRAFENRTLRRISGPSRDDVIGCLRKLHNDELRKLNSSPSTIRMRMEEDEMGRACSTNAEAEESF
jgi:hypothetical protein